MDMDNLFNGFGPGPGPISPFGLGGFGGCNESIWLILLLLFSSGNGCGCGCGGLGGFGGLFGGGNRCGCGCGHHHHNRNRRCCNDGLFGSNPIIWILILLIACGNNRPAFPIAPPPPVC